MFNFKEDWENPTKKAIQKMMSYKGYIPSKDMNEFHYEIYLKVAPPHELTGTSIKLTIGHLNPDGFADYERIEE
jgi:hypothetical protein